MNSELIVAHLCPQPLARSTTHCATTLSLRATPFFLFAAYEAARARHRAICEMDEESRRHVSQDFVPADDDAEGQTLPRADPNAGALGAAAQGGTSHFSGGALMRSHTRG